MNETTYYHGTPFDDSAKNIQQYGLGGNRITKRNGGANGDFASASNRQYITKSRGNAMRYATMMGNNGNNGHVFEFDIDNFRELGVDEDEIGNLIYHYLKGEIELPFRKELLNKLSQEDLKLIKSGNFRGFASTKKIIDLFNEKEIENILSLERVNNATITKPIKPSKHYSVRKPSEEEMNNLFKSKNFDPYDEYFDKNKVSESITESIMNRILKR